MKYYRFFLTAVCLGVLLFSLIGCSGNDDDDVAVDDDANNDDDSMADDDQVADDDVQDDDDQVDDDVIDDDAVDDDTSMDDDAIDDDAADDDCVPLFPDVLVASHRGANLLAPENTIPGIEAAFDQGADSVEIDVRETSDGHYVLMHDDTVDRTTNGSGLVNEMTLAEIKELLIKDWMYGHAWGDLRVPTLEEAMETIEEYGGQVDIDMKSDEPEGAIQIVVDMELENIVYVYSSSVDKLDRVRSVSTDVRIQPATSSVEETQALLDHFDPDPEHIELAGGGFTPENVELIHDAGLVVAMDALGERDIFAALGFKQAWFSMMDGGVDIILTDLPGALVEYRDSLCE